MTTLSRFIPCRANANHTNFTNYIFKFAELVKFVKFALKTMRGGRCIYCLTLVLLCCSLTAVAQDDMNASLPRLSMFTVEGGYASIHDSYLTPITYDGAGLGLGYEAMRPARFSPDKWLWQLQVGADYNYVENPARNNDLHKVMGNILFDMQRAWRGVLHPRLGFAAGPMTQLRAGIVYDAVNSNNPVTVHAHWNVGATGMAWFDTRMWRLPVTLRYQVQLPVMGVFFAPEYDESYYEIYLGNHKNLAHMGWWGNRVDMTHYLGVDMHLGGTTLRVGYRTRLEHWNANNLKVHDFGHALVLGISL